MANGVRINKAKTEALVFAMGQKAVLRAADRYRERVREEILAAGRIDTGEMYTRIDIGPLAPGPRGPRASVSPKAEHFIYQDRGTNGHTMPKGKVMVFPGKGTKVLVFARRVRGVRAGSFLAKARLKMRIDDFT